MSLKLSTAHFLVKHIVPILGNKSVFCRTSTLQKISSVFSYVLGFNVYIFKITFVALLVILHSL